jgi:parvulin-like peptidyl-prolyl isomerase
LTPNSPRRILVSSALAAIAASIALGTPPSAAFAAYRGAGSSASSVAPAAVATAAESAPEAAPPPPPSAPPPGVAAMVNGQDIPISVVSVLAVRRAGPGVMDQLIGNLLIEQEARRRKLEPTPAEIDQRLDDVRRRVQPRSLEDVVRQHRMTTALFRENIRVQIELRALLAKDLRPVRMVHLRDILINVRPDGAPDAPGDPQPPQHTEVEARAIVAKIQRQLKAGQRFADLARQVSEDHGNNDKGGDIGVITDTPNSSDNPAARAFAAQPEFLKAALALRPGGVSAPVRTVYGLHLLEADSTGDQPLPTDRLMYADARDRAVDAQLAAAAPKYVQSLRDAAAVHVYPDSTDAGPPGVAATVNGEDIATSSVADIALRAAGPSLTHELIINLLVHQEAKKQGVEATPAEIDSAIEQIREQLKPQILEDSLRQKHMAMEDLREVQRVRIEVDKLIRKTVPPPKMVHARRILIRMARADAADTAGGQPRSESQARAIIAGICDRLKAGTTFDDLARRYSEDPTSRDHSGDLGILTEKTPCDPALLSAALALKSGEITATPIRTSDGLELIQAVSTGDDPPPSERQLYSDAGRQAIDLEVQAQRHDYVPALLARSQVIDYLAD